MVSYVTLGICTYYKYKALHKALHPELRMIATFVLFETKLLMTLATTLADAVAKDANLQVASFVNSLMKAMTKCTAPDFTPV